MPYRWTKVRLVKPEAKIDVAQFWPFSLWRAALAAADETVQGRPFAAAWLRLFTTHLSSSEAVQLRWRDDLAQSTEMRRVLSALYGRYFARALLASELGITDFISLDSKVTCIPKGVTVNRIDNGDIPDWIGWDPQAGSYVLAEAKGRLTGSDQQFLNGTPKCVDAGKAQFERVEVRDSGGRIIATRNWVAAMLWSTEKRCRSPVSLLWDPRADGEMLTDEEATRHAAAIRGHRNAITQSRLGGPGLTVRIAIRPSDGGTLSPAIAASNDTGLRPFERLSGEPHEWDYQAVVITPFGIRPIRDKTDLQEALAIREGAITTGEPAMIFGLAKDESQKAESPRRPWLAENGIASSDGLSLFNLTEVEIGGR